MKRSRELSEEAAWELNTASFGPIARSADAIEGAVAFAEKREPNWQGK
jgi:enoyl-CoA hydratase